MLTRRLLGVVSLVALTCVVAVPAATAKTITTTKRFKLSPNTTATCTLADAEGFSDAGYILSGPHLRVREDNLVDPYPHQPSDLGQISRGGVSILAVGNVKPDGPFKVRVRTGKLSGSFTITLYVKRQS